MEPTYLVIVDAKRWENDRLESEFSYWTKYNSLDQAKAYAAFHNYAIDDYGDEEKARIYEVRELPLGDKLQEQNHA